MTRVLPALAAFVLLAAPAAAQTSASASIGSGVSSMSASGESGRTNVNASAEIERLFRSERLRIFYELDTGDYTTPGDWRFLSQRAGSTYRLDFGKSDRQHLYLGADGTFRLNGDSWSAADFRAAGAFANLEWQPRSGSTVRTGYRADMRRFPSAAALNQTQHSAFASVLANFQTRTTVIAQVTAGAKHYAAVSPTTEVIAVPIDHDATGQAQRGAGRYGVMASTTFVPVIVPGAPGSDARQITVLARIAQSLAARTGLSIEFSRRRVRGEVPPSVIATPAQFLEDGIYDDLFASNSAVGSVRLKSIVGDGIELTAEGVWLDKRYPATPAFDLDAVAIEGVLRHDRIGMARAEASFPLFPSRTGAIALDLVTGYEYTRHRSTSPLYDYVAHSVRVGMTIGY